MRLLTKTSLHYLWVSSVLLLAACCLWFVLLKSDISAEIKEQLELQTALVAHEIETGKTVQFPLVKIEKGVFKNLPGDVFKDTIIFDPYSNKTKTITC
jgi:hypothetical protein